MFPHLLDSRLLEIFGDVWAGLQTHLEPYISSYITDDRQGRLEDADRLPYTLDFLVMEELDFMCSIVAHASVRGEIEKQLTPEVLASGSLAGTWISQVVPILVGYSQITADDEGMWELDVNIFLAEETAETANYSPRSACSNFGVRLCSLPIAEALLAHNKSVFTNPVSRYVCSRCLGMSCADCNMLQSEDERSLPLHAQADT